MLCGAGCDMVGWRGREEGTLCCLSLAPCTAVECGRRQGSLVCPRTWLIGPCGRDDELAYDPLPNMLVCAGKRVN